MCASTRHRRVILIYKKVEKHLAFPLIFYNFVNGTQFALPMGGGKCCGVSPLHEAEASKIYIGMMLEQDASCMRTADNASKDVYETFVFCL